jgi:hypothetical protein
MILSQRTRATFAAAVLLVGLSACGNDDTDDGDATTTTTEAAASTTEGDDQSDDGDDADAMARAEAANLTIDDLPDGWNATPNGGDDDGSIFDVCGDIDLDAVTVAKANSDNFETTTADGGAISISTTSGVFASEGDATAMVDTLADQAFADCASGTFLDTLATDGVEGGLTAAQASELPDVADQIGSIGGQFTITAAEGDSGISVIVVAIRTGDLVTTISGTAIDAAPDGDLIESVIGLVAERQAG